MSTMRATNVGVHVDVNSLNMFERGSITGVVSLRIGNDYFPEQRWNDFLVIVLGWWLDRMLQLWLGQVEDREGVKCSFMDGAFYFNVSPLNEERWLVECWKGVPGIERECEAEVERSAFMQDLLSCASLVLNACQSKGWKKRELDELAAIITRVTNEVMPQLV